MVQKIKIGNKFIGENQPVFVIAEAGVNHNGRLDLAKKLIDKAAEAGADAVKFQTFKAEKLVTRKAEMADYQKKNIGKTESQYAMLKKLELKDRFHKPLFDYAKKKGLIFMSTPFDEDAIDFLDELGVPIFKAGSSDTNNIPYLIKMAKKKKPILLSTGMSDMREIKESVDAILRYNKQLIVLHCTTDYPCPYDQVDLRVMKTMRKKLGTLIGYSDHTNGLEVPVAAVALGANVIEKHFTLSRKMKGPDHKALLEPGELKQMVTQIRNIEKALGKNKKIITEVAKKYISVAKKSVVANHDIRKGEKFTNKNLGIKRPGTGLAPKYYFNILGKRAKKDIEEDKLIRKNDYI